MNRRVTTRIEIYEDGSASIVDYDLEGASLADARVLEIENPDGLAVGGTIGEYLDGNLVVPLSIRRITMRREQAPANDCGATGDVVPFKVEA